MNIFYWNKSDFNVEYSASRFKGEFCFRGRISGKCFSAGHRSSPVCCEAELSWQDLVFSASFNCFPVQHPSPFHLWAGRLKSWCSCSAMRSDFLWLTLKCLPGVTHKPLLDQGCCVSCESPPREREVRGERIWLLHLKQIKVSFFPQSYSLVSGVSHQTSASSHGRKVSSWPFYAFQSFLSLQKLFCLHRGQVIKSVRWLHPSHWAP